MIRVSIQKCDFSTGQIDANIERVEIAEDISGSVYLGDNSTDVLGDAYLLTDAYVLVFLRGVFIQLSQGIINIQLRHDETAELPAGIVDHIQWPGYLGQHCLAGRASDHDFELAFQFLGDTVRVIDLGYPIGVVVDIVDLPLAALAKRLGVELILLSVKPVYDGHRCSSLRAESFRFRAMNVFVDKEYIVL